MCVLAGCKTCHSTNCKRNIALFGNNCNYTAGTAFGGETAISRFMTTACDIAVAHKTPAHTYARSHVHAHTFNGNKDNHGSGGRNITAVPHRGNRSLAGPAGKAAIYEQIENLIWRSYITVIPRLPDPLSKNDTGPRHSKRWRQHIGGHSRHRVIALMRR